MRRGNDNKILMTDDGQMLGVALGADYCAEHEWGIKKLQNLYGFGDPEKFGLARRQITKPNPLLVWLDSKPTKVYRNGKNQTVKCSGFMSKVYSHQEDALPSFEFGFYGDKTLWTGWSEQDFGVFTINADDVPKLRELYDHIVRLDAAIWLGGGGVFKNAGLGIAIASRLSKDVTDLWDQSDRDHKKLKEDAEATGIEARLRAAGLQWYALSPKRQSDGSIVFWLNPEKQDQYEACWATVQDLDDWIAGKGKIIKPQSNKRNTR